MPGNGQRPLVSAWMNQGRFRVGSSLLRDQLMFGNAGTEEASIWNNWFFGASGALFNQAVNVTCATSASLLRAIAKKIPVTCSSSALVSALAGGLNHLVTITVSCTSSVSGSATSIVNTAGSWIAAIKSKVNWTIE
jgi:hypothetical protein